MLQTVAQGFLLLPARLKLKYLDSHKRRLRYCTGFGRSLCYYANIVYYLAPGTIPPAMPGRSVHCKTQVGQSAGLCGLIYTCDNHGESPLKEMACLLHLVWSLCVELMSVICWRNSTRKSTRNSLPGALQLPAACLVKDCVVRFSGHIGLSFLLGSTFQAFLSSGISTQQSVLIHTSTGPTRA